MQKATTAVPFAATTTTDASTEILRSGARELLAAALNAEVAAHIEAAKLAVDEHGRRLVVRNGYLPAREISTGIGPVEVRQPRVDDRRVDADGERVRFSSSILPPYLRRTKSLEELIP